AAARGERGVPVEQLLRDLRVGRIFDGSTEAMRGFIAQEALAEHPTWPVTDEPRQDSGPLAEHLGFVDQASRELARHVAHARVRWPDELSERQRFVGRVVDIGAELYAMSVSCVYARARTDNGEAATDLADTFCRHARRRVAELFDRLWHNTDDHDRAIAARVLDDRYTWLEEGILDPSIEGPWLAEPTPGPSGLPNLHRPVT
ncbi:MAG TPA: acyl-CoA dehydrogenase, partial [Actinophytocola sp.]|nr:acyl-CoA dehydrogenase [Actinophytocola sp.]